MRSEKTHDLIQLQGDKKHRFSLIPLCNQLLVDILNGTNVQAAGRLDGNDQRLVPV